MFVYCGNNPVMRIDDSGEWWNVAIGAVVGCAVSAISTALQGRSETEILVSAACGFLSGGLAAMGIGGLGGQMAIGALASAIDSGLQNYTDYTSGKKSFKEAIVGTIVDTGLGAAFGAMSFNGTDAFEASKKMASNAHNAIKKLLQRTVHPNIRKSSEKIIRQSVKYIANEFKSSFIDNTLSAASSYGIGRLAELYY